MLSSGRHAKPFAGLRPSCVAICSTVGHLSETLRPLRGRGLGQMRVPAARRLERPDGRGCSTAVPLLDPGVEVEVDAGHSPERDSNKPRR
jgi:hypothetical protein